MAHPKKSRKSDIACVSKKSSRVIETALKNIPTPKTRKSWSQENKVIRLHNLYFIWEEAWKGFEAGKEPDTHPETRTTFKITFSTASIFSENKIGLTLVLLDFNWLELERKTCFPIKSSGAFCKGESYKIYYTLYKIIFVFWVVDLLLVNSSLGLVDI